MLLWCYNDVISNTFYCSTAFITEVTVVTSAIVATSATAATAAAVATPGDPRLGFPFVEWALVTAVVSLDSVVVSADLAPFGF